MKKSILMPLSIAFAMLPITGVYAEITEVQCSTNPVYAQNSCTQCFTQSDEKSQGDTIGLLSDEWKNESPENQIVYKEEQKMPFMVNLSESTTTWTQVPDADGFWEYTDAFNALYDNKEQGYVLKAGDNVTWLKSKLGYGFNLEKNTAAKGTEIGLLVYPFKTHNILSTGEITVDDEEHRECVVYMAGPTPETPVTPTPEQPKPELPKTGPEHIILIAIALLLGFGLIVFTRKA